MNHTMSDENKQYGDGLNYTDVGNGERLARRHGQDIRYCKKWHKWLFWDGQRWQVDAADCVTQRAKETVRALYSVASSITDDHKRKELLSHAQASEQAGRIRAMVEMAKSEPGLRIDPLELDSNPWLLNCPNGTVDLQTGEMRPHSRDDYITKMSPVEYAPEATCPLWLEFLEQIFAHNNDLVGFVQRLLGYSLTGRVNEQVLPIFYGKGANGKSTMLAVVMEMLGLDYAIKAAPDLVLMKGGTHPTERADLFGKRLVACIETDAGRRLAEAFVKDLTGGDKQRARHLYEDFWEFNPTHKIVLACNHKPTIKGTDHAMWRRIRLVPFDVTIPDDQQDKNLIDKLLAELPGILVWCVRGCLAWQRNGLGAPEEVKSATASYRQQQDRISAFIAECCVAGGKAQARPLYLAYKQWCEECGEDPLTEKQFGETMEDRGWDRKGIKGKRWYVGLGLVEVEGRG